jgi:hypothetical protein
VATAFVRSLLSWQRAAILNSPIVLLTGIDRENAAVSLPAAKKWTAFLAFMAGNFEKIIADAVPSCEDDHIELQHVRNILAAIREAHDHAQEHVAVLANARSRVRRAELRTTLAYVRSLSRWQDALLCYCSPTAFARLLEIDQAGAAVELAPAREWVTFLDTLVKSLAEMAALAETHGIKSNAAYALSCVRDALRHAEEHVASFSDASAPVAASKPPT